jgi:CBS domain-containing protein
MVKVRDIMVENVVIAKQDDTIRKAIEMLYKKHVGSLIITDENEKCIGIFTERDAIRVVAQKMSLDKPIKRVMTKHVMTIREDATFEEARRYTVSHGIRHLPVLDRKGKLVGLLSIRQFLDELFGIKSLKP